MSGWYGAYPAVVVDGLDPDGTGRVRVRFPWLAPSSGEVEAWARTATLGAGPNAGIWALPRPGDEVVVVFEEGDPARPYVVGSVWNGRSLAPALPAERLVVRSRSGAELAFDDGKGEIRISTPDGAEVVVAPGLVEVRDGAGAVVRLSGGTVEVSTGGKVEVHASQVDVSAGMVTVEAAMTRFSGVVQAETVIAANIVGSNTPPGAGNLW